MQQPLRIVNGVEIYDYLAVTPGVQETGLKKMAIPSYNIRQLEDTEKILPGFFPNIEFGVSIVQATYLKVLEMWRNEQNPLSKTMYTKFLINLHSDLNVDLNSINNLERWYYDSYDPDRNPRVDLDSLKREITEAYNERGFIFHYFGWINSTHPLFMAKMGAIPLRPDTFEIGSTIHYSPETYGTILKRLKNSGSDISCFINRDKRNVVDERYMGWSKFDLANAIKTSGLVTRVLRNPVSAKKLNVQSNYIDGIRWKDAGIKTNRKYPILPGLMSNRYLSQCYYETIYRKIFNTMSFINWSLLCQYRAVPYNTLKTVAVTDFGMDYRDVRRMTYPELCNAIGEIATQRSDVTKNLALTASQVAPEIILQPYSAWINPPTRQQFREGGKIKDAFKQYNMLRDLCNSNSSREDLIELTENIGIRRMLPSDLTSYSKEDICQYLLDFYKPKAEAYGQIEFDCANPNIDKMNIINSAIIMDLGGIFPDDITDYSKEDICLIINDYLQILKDTKQI